MATFDYTNRDYDSIQADLLARASRVLPEWTSRDSSDFGVLMVDLWAYMGDTLHYYIDRAAKESFLGTATQRESVIAIANLLDYLPSGRRPARASITINAANTTASDSAPIYIPKNTRFLASPLVDTASPVIFTSDTPIAFVGTSTGASANLVSDGVTYATFTKSTVVSLALTEGELFTETYTATGLLNQRITLRKTGIVTNSINVTVNEGAAGAAISYAYVDRLLLGNSSDKIFAVDVTADNYSVVVFGNNVNGNIPAVNANVSITYRRSRGGAGNVVVGAIKSIESTLIPNKPSLDGLVVIPNTGRAVGGVDLESMASLKANIPASFRSQDRAVSIQDYRDLVLRVPGIVRAIAYLSGSTVEILAASEPDSYGSANTLVLTTDEITKITDYLNPREITFVTSNVGASVSLTPIHIVGSVQIKDNFIQEIVYANVVIAIKDLFIFDNTDFGNKVSLGELYRTILAVDGVDYAVITRFTTTGSNVIDSSSGFTGVQAATTSMLVFSQISTAFTLVPSGGIVASGG